MSLLFDNEMVTEPPAPYEPTLAEHEDALADLTAQKSTSVAGARLRSFDRAERLYHLARLLEPSLLVEIAEGRVASVLAAKNWILAQDGVPSWFPAAKMVAIMIARAGGTPALLRAAAIRECGG
jgi:hypothetical protein